MNVRETWCPDGTVILHEQSCPSGYLLGKLGEANVPRDALSVLLQPEEERTEDISTVLLPGRGYFRLIENMIKTNYNKRNYN